MNKIFGQVQDYMLKALEEALPSVKKSDLEKDGAVFYMNGKNGTEFDWYVNDHLPCFFIFYNDKENLGAVKATLYTDGGLSVYVYGDRGHADPFETNYTLDADEKELLYLAVLLAKNADGNKVWDDDIRKLDCEGTPDEESVKVFLSLKDAFEPMIERKNMMGQIVMVSKKVREGGYKIGYGIRDEPVDDRDSGWFFSVGDETDEYINDTSNVEIWSVNSALMYEPALMEFITEPYGTGIVRVSPDKFELDEPGKKIFIEKKK